MKHVLDFSTEIYGEGKYLYTVTYVDTNDPEDTTVDLRFADSDAELFEELMSEVIGDTDYTEEQMEQMKEHFDLESMQVNLWGAIILVKKVAEKS